MHLLAAAANDKSVGPLVIARLVSACRLTPRSYRMTTAGGLALTSAVRMIDEDGAAGEEVLGALAEEEADVHGTLDDDDVGEGEGKEEKDEEGGESDRSAPKKRCTGRRSCRPGAPRRCLRSRHTC